MNDFKPELWKYAQIVEQALLDYINNWQMEQESLREAMKYSLSAGGKRIRPIMMLAVADVYQLPYRKVLPYACALEMVHTYSLIHDDLPCMDDDDLRRGKPTSHKVFGEALALLAGDALLYLASELMIEDVILNQGDIKHLVATKIILKAAGANGMLAGQVIDKEAEGAVLSKEELTRLHSLKTGALFEASLLAAAEICDASIKDKKIFADYAKKIGLAFQINDDLLDVIGDGQLLGKNVGGDINSEKNTFVKLLGLEAAKDEATRLTDEAVNQLRNLKGNIWFLENMAYFLVKRDY